MKKVFKTRLASPRSKIIGGFGSGQICPRAIADEVFGAGVEGAWLQSYMLRRFGWPNCGSDDYKDTMAWTLVTPIPGLFLSVIPYMGGGSANLHFGVRYTASVDRKMRDDPGRLAYWQRWKRFLNNWWKTQGRKLYTFGSCEVGDQDEELVHHYAEQDGVVHGLWKRRSEHPAQPRLAEGLLLFPFWFNDFLKATHPEVRLPKMRKREQEARHSRFHREAIFALKVTMRDLLRFVNVRDVSFTVMGRELPEHLQEFDRLPAADWFEGAGYAPEYWFKNRRSIRAATTRSKSS